MARMACVDLPAFPLQILLKRNPEWRGQPVAVIAEDRPQGVLLWVNEPARAGRVLPGMRYAGALSLARELRAGVVAPAEIEREVEALLPRLRFFSPEVEPAQDDPGTFWLGAEGLGLLHPEVPRWAGLIRADLRQAGYEGRIAAGFSRFGCYAAARALVRSPIAVFGDPEEERAAVRRIPIDRIACDPKLRETLARLGIHELGGFLDLPPGGIRRRFGEEAYALHRQASGEAWVPFAPEAGEEPHERRIPFDQPEMNTARLLHAIERELRALLDRLRARDRALTALVVELGFDYPGPDGVRRRLETVKPATPTRDLNLLLDRLRLRLESIRFPSGAMDVRLEVSFAAGTAEQMVLFPERPRRDLDAAARALARVRAEFGDEAVCAARLVEAHLPEARFTLEPVERIQPAKPRKVHLAPVVRRILARPEPIALSRPQRSEGFRDDSPVGRVILGLGRIAEAAGPFVVSGGWWRRLVVRRYWYARVETGRVETGRVEGERPGGERANDGHAKGGQSSGKRANGEQGDEPRAGVWLWIYHDARRRRWFRQGEVE